MSPHLEIALFTPHSALPAQNSGASRLELCRSRSSDGLTPLLSSLTTLRPVITIPIHVMIRPHSLSFHYSDSDFILMKNGILEFKDNGADGFVFGILDEGNRVDVERCRELVKLAGGTKCTFHRAFDTVIRERGVGEGMEELEKIIECGFTSVLTSGGGMNAWEGRGVIKKLVAKATGRIEILVGGGVRANNLAELKGDIGNVGVGWHTSAVMDGGEEASEDEVRALRKMVDSF
ncbi:hypothetical protein B7494_g4405 [Chlorociboria aeruginascens]|nr:hypothetical protein B7494_g4405 [Chlorociboria aeruginascens]